MPLITKTFTELNSDSTTRLVNLGYTDAQFEATAVRDVVEAVDLHLAALYEDMRSNLEGNYLSSATADVLDALGLLLGVRRRGGENDTNLRYRIANALTVAKSANLQAHLDALFAITNIRDVIAKPFTQGVGSLTFYLIGIQGIVDAPTIALAQKSLASISAAGAYTVIKTPTPITVNITATIATNITTGQSATDLNGSASRAISNYLSNLTMGSGYVVSAFDQVVLDAGNGAITDFNLVTISTVDAAGNTTERLLGNYTPLFDQELEPGTILISG